MVDIVVCPVCQGRSLKNFRSCKDYTVSHETFTIKRCENCALAITTPRPATAMLGNYYQSEEYISHSGKSSGGIGSIYKIARTFALRWKKQLVEKYATKGTLLDFGCGTGEFLQTVKQAGWKTSGIEPSQNARTKSEALTQQKIYAGLEELETERFDAITAWHVLEHVPDLTETLQKMVSLLKKDGTIFIAVPNYESADAEKYKEFWAGYDVPRHLWHFSKKSMALLLASNGLNLIGTRPMKLDSFYVSMLSEKYRGGKPALANLLKGVTSGLGSNLKAGRDNYSSLIYIAKPI
jgi:2-polyprenyl-3-methyl-5-hydroxy-6-metoxy-1,4-benzoquinol methylase